jgi:hypothetical protein
MHWVSHRDYEPELAHFRIYGKQTPMEQTA